MSTDESARHVPAGPGPDGGSGVVELSGAPRTAALYRRALLGALPLPGRSAGAGTLPDTGLVLRGVSIDRGHLAAYDRVCGFGLSDRLPATYPHVLAFPLAMRLMTAPDFPFPAVGLVHVANRIEQLRPIDAGATLDLAVHAADLRPHERGRQLDLVATATVDGDVVWRGVSTYLRREGGTHTGGGHGDRDRTPAPAPTAVWRVPASVAAAYARVSGDRNPIHTSRIGARLFGFPRPIAHGMWSKARCLAALAGRLPDSYTVDVQFKLPVLLPATVAFSAAPRPPSGWTFALHDATSGRPHLAGGVTGPPEAR